MVAACAVFWGAAGSGSWQGDGRRRADPVVGQSDLSPEVCAFAGGCFTTTRSGCDGQGQELMVLSVTDSRILTPFKHSKYQISLGALGLV